MAIKNQNLDTRILIEEGIIIKKEFKNATEPGEFNGRKYEGKPDRYVITTLSAPVIDVTMGCQTYNVNGELTSATPVILDFEISVDRKKEYEAYKFGDKVNVRYTYRNVNGQEIFKSLDFKKLI